MVCKWWSNSGQMVVTSSPPARALRGWPPCALVHRFIRARGFCILLAVSECVWPSISPCAFQFAYRYVYLSCLHGSGLCPSESAGTLPARIRACLTRTARLSESVGLCLVSVASETVGLWLSLSLCECVSLSLSLSVTVSVCFCLPVSVCPSHSISVNQSVRSVCLYLSVSVCLSLITVCLSLSVSVCLFRLCLSVSAVCVHLPACLPACLSLCLPVRLSVCRSVGCRLSVSIAVFVCPSAPFTRSLHSAPLLRVPLAASPAIRCCHG